MMVCAGTLDIFLFILYTLLFSSPPLFLTIHRLNTNLYSILNCLVWPKGCFTDKIQSQNKQKAKHLFSYLSQRHNPTLFSLHCLPLSLPLTTLSHCLFKSQSYRWELLLKDALNMTLGSNNFFGFE